MESRSFARARSSSTRWQRAEDSRRSRTISKIGARPRAVAGPPGLRRSRGAGRSGSVGPAWRALWWKRGRPASAPSAIWRKRARPSVPPADARRRAATRSSRRDRRRGAGVLRARDLRGSRDDRVHRAILVDLRVEPAIRVLGNVDAIDELVAEHARRNPFEPARDCWVPPRGERAARAYLGSARAFAPRSP